MPEKREGKYCKSKVSKKSASHGEALADYGWFRCGREDRIDSLDGAGIEILHIPRNKKIKGLPFNDLFGIRSLERKRILHSMKNNHGRFLGEVGISRHDGSSGVILLDEMLMVGEKGDAEGSEGIFIDVTSERKWERELFIIARDLGGSLDERQIIDKIALDLSRVTGFHVCSVVLFDEDGVKVHVRSAAKIGKAVLENLADLISRGIGLFLEYTIDSSDMKIESRILPKMQSPGARGKKQIKVHHTIPLLVRTRMVGLVHLGSFSPLKLSQRDKASLLTCSSPMTFALHNARSFGKEKKLNQMKSEFFSNVSHALRTPMATMKQCISLLLRERGGPLNDTQRNFLGMIGENIDRLTGILNNLLDLSKIEHGSMELNRTEIDMVFLVKSIVHSFKPLIQSKGIALTVKPEEPSIRAFVDSEIMRQIIESLLSNAVKFTSRNKGVTLTLSTSRKRVMVTIEDEGSGMSKENLAMVFDKYRSFQKGIRAGVKGTGLGLALSKELVELHGGKIWIKSSPRKGTEVSFVIPKMPFASIVQEKVKQAIQLSVIKKEGFVLFLYIANLDEALPSPSKIKKLKQRLGDYLGPVLANIEGQMIIDEEEERVAVLAPVKKKNRESVERALKRNFKELLMESRTKNNSIFSSAHYPDDGQSFAELLEVLLKRAGVVEETIHLQKEGGERIE